MSSSEVDPSFAFFFCVRGCPTSRRLLSSEEVTVDGLQAIVCDWMEAEGVSAERIAEAREWAGQRARLLRFVEPGRCISLLEDEAVMPILWLERDDPLSGASGRRRVTRAPRRDG